MCFSVISKKNNPQPFVISKKDNPQPFDDLLKYRFWATSSGETFITIHGDLVIEHFNKKKVKGRLEPIDQDTTPITIRLTNGL